MPALWCYVRIHIRYCSVWQFILTLCDNNNNNTIQIAGKNHIHKCTKITILLRTNIAMLPKIITNKWLWQWMNVQVIFSMNIISYNEPHRCTYVHAKQGVDHLKVIVTVRLNMPFKLYNYYCFWVICPLMSSQKFAIMFLNDYDYGGMNIILWTVLREEMDCYRW